MVFIKGDDVAPDDEGPVPPNILAIRAYQARIDAANAPVQTAIERAIDGDSDFAKIVFDRIAPPPKGRFTRMDAPPTGLGLAGPLSDTRGYRPKTRTCPDGLRR
jgi:hypothetical protein